MKFELDKWEKVLCPVCGYYCLGKGGFGCIDKPGFQKPLTEKIMKCWDKCPVCGSEWIGGSCLPGEDMPEGRRVFYDCGMSVSITNGCILMKNCIELEREVA